MFCSKVGIFYLGTAQKRPQGSAQCWLRTAQPAWHRVQEVKVSGKSTHFFQSQKRGFVITSCYKSKPELPMLQHLRAFYKLLSPHSWHDLKF